MRRVHSANSSEQFSDLVQELSQNKAILQQLDASNQRLANQCSYWREVAQTKSTEINQAEQLYQRSIQLQVKNYENLKIQSRNTIQKHMAVISEKERIIIDLRKSLEQAERAESRVQQELVSLNQRFCEMADKAQTANRMYQELQMAYDAQKVDSDLQHEQFNRQLARLKDQIDVLRRSSRIASSPASEPLSKMQLDRQETQPVRLASRMKLGPQSSDVRFLKMEELQSVRIKMEHDRGLSYETALKLLLLIDNYSEDLRQRDSQNAQLRDIILKYEKIIEDQRRKIQSPGQSRVIRGPSERDQYTNDLLETITSLEYTIREYQQQVMYLNNRLDLVEGNHHAQSRTKAGKGVQEGSLLEKVQAQLDQQRRYQSTLKHQIQTLNYKLQMAEKEIKEKTDNIAQLNSYMFRLNSQDNKSQSSNKRSTNSLAKHLVANQSPKQQQWEGSQKKPINQNIYETNFLRRGPSPNSHQQQIVRLINQIELYKVELENLEKINAQLQERLKKTQPKQYYNMRQLQFMGCQEHIDIIRDLERKIKTYELVTIPDFQIKVSEFRKLYEEAAVEIVSKDTTIRLLREQITYFKRARPLEDHRFELAGIYRNSPNPSQQMLPGSHTHIPYPNQQHQQHQQQHQHQQQQHLKHTHVHQLQQLPSNQSIPGVPKRTELVPVSDSTPVRSPSSANLAKYKYIDNQAQSKHRLDELIRVHNLSALGIITLATKLLEISEKLLRSKSPCPLVTENIYIFNYDQNALDKMKIRVLECKMDAPLTKKYMPPEVLRGHQTAVTELVLLWNIGTIVDEVVNKKLYFKNQQEILDFQRSYKYENKVLPGLKRLLESLLCKQPTQRLSIKASKQLLALELSKQLSR